MGTWERVEEAGSPSLLSSGMFSYYVFTPHGDVIASDGFCAGVVTTYDLSRDGSLTLKQESREQRRIDALEVVRSRIGGIGFSSSDPEEDEKAVPTPTVAEVEAAYQRARSKSEGERTELEFVAFIHLSEFDAEDDSVNEFEIAASTGDSFVLKKSNGTGHIRFKRKKNPLTPASFYAGGASELPE